MPSRDFSGDDVVKILDRHGYQQVRPHGSHRIFKYRNEDTGEIRTVSVPDHDRIRTGTLRKIMKQAGGEDFDAFCEWIENSSIYCRSEVAERAEVDSYGDFDTGYTRVTFLL